MVEGCLLCHLRRKSSGKASGDVLTFDQSFTPFEMHCGVCQVVVPVLTEMQSWPSGKESHRSSSGQEMPKLRIKPSQPCLDLSQKDLQGRSTSPPSHLGAYTMHTKRRMSTWHTVCTKALKKDILMEASRWLVWPSRLGNMVWL